MRFFRKKESTATKVARTTGALAGKAVRTGKKTAAAVTAAGLAARRAMARRKARKTLAKAGRSMKTAGKVAAVAGLAAAAAFTASEALKRQRNA